VKKFYMQL